MHKGVKTVKKNELVVQTGNSFQHLQQEQPVEMRVDNIGEEGEPPDLNG